MFLAIAILFYCFSGHIAEGILGVDVSSEVSVSEFECLKSNGVQFVIVRAYQSLCHPDDSAPQTISNAKKAGISYVDVYLFPSPHCEKTAAEQVHDMANYLGNSDYGQIWLDIEGPQYWHSGYSSNQDFFMEMLKTSSTVKKTGVYSSKSQWDEIMGRNYTGGSNHQLWYAHYDNNPSFSDFEPFGGWSKPSIKQYVGDATLCGASIDKNYY